MGNFFRHLHTVCHHRRLVRRNCFRVGLYLQGLTHDLSKFSPAEFWPGVRYYQGRRSPNTAEREALGYSRAWMHHKGRNRHHFEYWTDISPVTNAYEAVQMPPRYLAEMVMDRIAASKTYLKDRYTDASPLAYYQTAKESRFMNSITARQLEYLLIMLRDCGEEKTFKFIRDTVLKGYPFAET